MVQSFEHNGSVELEKCEVLETPPESCLEGDMNPFLGNTIFPMETRKILALYFRRKGQKNNFCEDMVRFLCHRYSYRSVNISVSVFCRTKEFKFYAVYLGGCAGSGKKRNQGS